MLDPNEQTVDVMHPGNGQIITMPLSVAQQVGVTPDMIVPRAGDVQRTITEDPGAPPPQAPPPAPPPQPPPPPSQGGSAGVAGLANANNSARATLGLLHLGNNTGAGDELAAPSSPSQPPAGAAAFPPGSVPQALPFQHEQGDAARTSLVPPPSGAALGATTAPGDGGAGAPMSTADLQKAGIGGAYNATIGALKGVEEAGKKTADAEAAQQVAFANAYEQRNAQVDNLLKQRADDADAKAKEIDGRMADYDATVKKFADAKIDRGVDHPIVAAISALLGAIGQAATNSQSNPALDLLFKQTERKAQAQMDDRAALGQVIGMKRNDIEMIRQKASDSTARYNLTLAGEIEKTARQVEAIGARSNSDIVRGRAGEAAAALRQKGADALGTAVMAQQNKDEKDRAFKEQVRSSKASEGIQYGHLALAKKSLDEQIREHDLQRQDKLDEIALGDRRLGAKERAERAKEVATSGVFDPTSGAAVLTPDGQKIIDQADKLEIAARKMPPAEQAAALAQAKNLRDQAEAVGGFTIGDKDIRKDVIKKVGASQDMINTIDDIKATLATDPSSIDRTTWAALETKYETAKAAFIEAHGAKMSSREMDAVHDMFGASPADMTTRLGGRGKMLARLDALEQGAIGGTTTELHANGYKGAWTPRHVGGDAPEVLSGATSLEKGDDAQLGKVGEKLSFTTNAKRSLDAENNADTGPSGLSKQDTTVVQQLARKYDNASDSERDRIRSQLQAYASSSRPGLAQGVVNLVNAENPALYKEIAATTPNAARTAGDGTAIQAANDQVAHNQVLASTPIDNLLQAAAAGDGASKTEIIRRAANPAKPDPQARAALNQLIQAKR